MLSVLCIEIGLEDLQRLVFLMLELNTIRRVFWGYPGNPMIDPNFIESVLHLGIKPVTAWKPPVTVLKFRRAWLKVGCARFLYWKAER